MGNGRGGRELGMPQARLKRRSAAQPENVMSFWRRYFMKEVWTELVSLCCSNCRVKPAKETPASLLRSEGSK